jgi:hypothetical protein
MLRCCCPCISTACVHPQVVAPLILYRIAAPSAVHRALHEGTSSACTVTCCSAAACGPAFRYAVTAYAALPGQNVSVQLMDLPNCSYRCLEKYTPSIQVGATAAISTCVAKVEGQVAALQHCANDAFSLVRRSTLARRCIAVGCHLQYSFSNFGSILSSCHMQSQERGSTYNVCRAPAGTASILACML